MWRRAGRAGGGGDSVVQSRTRDEMRPCQLLELFATDSLGPPYGIMHKSYGKIGDLCRISSLYLYHRIE